MASSPVEVVALALKRKFDGRYMLARRNPNSSGAGNLEFPGGKIESGEDGPQALVREIFEEFSYQIQIDCLIYIASHEYSYPNKVIRLHLWQLEIQEVPDFILIDHDKIEWCLPSEMHRLKISPADIFFINRLL